MSHYRSPDSVVRVGIVGLGQLSREVHLPILRTLPQVTVEAIADPDYHAASRCRELAPQARIYSSIKDLLREAPVDAVLVASPTGEHTGHAGQVLDAGKALYLEKPLASTLEAGRALVQMAEGAGPPAMMGFNYRFHPRVARCLAQRPQSIRCVRSAFSIAPRPVPAWKQKRASGGGVLLDLASHHFDLLRLLLGARPESVEARVWSERTEDDCCEVELTFDNGVQAFGSYSLCGTERDTIEIEPAGSRNPIVLNRYAPLRYPLLPIGEFIEYQWERRRSPWKEVSFRRSLCAWIESVRSGKTPPVTLADGLESLRVVAAAEESAHKGERVSIGMGHG
jgi:myo-inositol 2-dehydrogenase / D-chiro-inositol 1-dehydrogenase